MPCIIPFILSPYYPFFHPKPPFPWHRPGRWSRILMMCFIFSNIAFEFLPFAHFLPHFFRAAVVHRQHTPEPVPRSVAKWRQQTEARKRFELISALSSALSRVNRDRPVLFGATRDAGEKEREQEREEIFKLYITVCVLTIACYAIRWLQ